MLRTLFIGLVALILGATLGILGYRAVIPPTDLDARVAAFEPENADWFYQNASEVFPTRTVRRSEVNQPYQVDTNVLDGFTFEFEGKTRTIEDLYTDMETSGLIILHKGKLVHESYGRGASSGTQFTTYSLVKSFTSTLVGFAVGDGLIASVDDPLTKYLPALEGTSYEGVSVKHALEMSSGVKFDPGGLGDMSDTVAFITDSAVLGKKTAFDIAKSFPRAAEPGTVFNYNTAETQILLELVRAVTGKTASVYLEEKMWHPLGMEHDAGWILDQPGREGVEFGGAFFNASLRDWARFGQFIEQGGVWNGEQLLPVDWVDQATWSDEPHLQAGKVHPNPNRGYAWQWWTFTDGTFTGSGAYGQTVYIDRENDIVVARSSAWPQGWVKEHGERSYAFFKALGDWEFEPVSAGAPVAALPD